MTSNTLSAKLARVVLSSLVLGFLVQAHIAPAEAASTTYNVTRTDDPNAAACGTPVSGCSLRQALVAIAADPAGGPYVVNLPAGNYSNDLGAQFPITGDVSIVGAGSATTTVNGSANSRVFYLTGSNATVSISGVTITGGHSTAAGGQGGGIGMGDVNGLSLSRVAVIGNTAYYSGGIEVRASAANQFHIADSLVAGNSTTFSSGGGIGFEYADSPATITNVTITGNSAVGQGGGLALSNTIGGPGKVAISNSTISGNSATTSGGNIAGDAFTIRNSIVAGGAAAVAGTENCTLVPATPSHSLGYNIDSSDQCLKPASTGDQVNTDPKLGPLPASPDASTALPLLQNSPAINAGNPTGCKDAGGAVITHDQRGISRPQGTVCDIGAYELRAPSFTGAPTITGTTAVGQTLTCTLHLGVVDTSMSAGPTWLRDNIPVSTATTYKIVLADAGHALRCRADASNTAGAASSLSAARNVPPPCVVPSLKGRTLKAAKAKLVRAHCRLGTVKKPHTHAKLVVKKQSLKPGTRTTYGTKVNVTLKKK